MNQPVVPREKTEAILKLVAEFCGGLSNLGAAGTTLSVVMPDSDRVGHAIHLSWGFTEAQRREVLDSAMADLDQSATITTLN
jgi:hypothetical protein